MCNGIAFRLHLRPGGDEVVLDRTSHPIVAEAGGPAAISGAMLSELDGDGGRFTAEQLEAAIRPPDRYLPRTRLVSVEQTTNLAGGRVWPLEQIDAVVATARSHGLRAHLDGARLINAVVAAGVEARRVRRRVRHRLAGLLQGPGGPGGRGAVRLGRADRGGLALQADVGRRAAPGRRARGGLPLRAGPPRRSPGRGPRQRQGCSRAGSGSRSPTTEHRDLPDRPTPASSKAKLVEHGVEASVIAPGRLRFVTHLGVDRAGVERAVEAFAA